ncbi:hypothetical protein BKA69DRAFT_1061723 [Paraphysoderma sedebokerense]|nr:hypothetical protein BKA69DRAFT_1061723 [Paraphysoderma sedebokerense]
MMTTSSMENLPPLSDELWLQIFSHLDHPSHIVQVSIAARTFHRLCNDNRVWYNLYRHRFPRTSKYIPPFACSNWKEKYQSDLEFRRYWKSPIGPKSFHIQPTAQVKGKLRVQRLVPEDEETGRNNPRNLIYQDVMEQLNAFDATEEEDIEDNEMIRSMVQDMEILSDDETDSTLTETNGSANSTLEFYDLLWHLHRQSNRDVNGIDSVGSIYAQETDTFPPDQSAGPSEPSSNPSSVASPTSANPPITTSSQAPLPNYNFTLSALKIPNSVSKTSITISRSVDEVLLDINPNISDLNPRLSTLSQSYPSILLCACRSRTFGFATPKFTADSSFDSTRILIYDYPNFTHSLYHDIMHIYPFPTLHGFDIHQVNSQRKKAGLPELSSIETYLLDNPEEFLEMFVVQVDAVLGVYVLCIQDFGRNVTTIQVRKLWEDKAVAPPCESTSAPTTIPEGSSDNKGEFSESSPSSGTPNTKLEQSTDFFHSKKPSGVVLYEYKFDRVLDVVGARLLFINSENDKWEFDFRKHPSLSSSESFNTVNLSTASTDPSNKAFQQSNNYSYTYPPHLASPTPHLFLLHYSKSQECQCHGTLFDLPFLQISKHSSKNEEVATDGVETDDGNSACSKEPWQPQMKTEMDAVKVMKYGKGTSYVCHDGGYCGDWVVTGHTDGYIRIYHLTSGQLLKQIPIYRFPVKPVDGVRYRKWDIIPFSCSSSISSQSETTNQLSRSSKSICDSSVVSQFLTAADIYTDFDSIGESQVNILFSVVPSVPSSLTTFPSSSTSTYSNQDLTQTPSTNPLFNFAISLPHFVSYTTGSSLLFVITVSGYFMILDIETEEVLFKLNLHIKRDEFANCFCDLFFVGKDKRAVVGFVGRKVWVLQRCA